MKLFFCVSKNEFGIFVNVTLKSGLIRCSSPFFYYTSYERTSYRSSLSYGSMSLFILLYLWFRWDNISSSLWDNSYTQFEPGVKTFYYLGDFIIFYVFFDSKLVCLFCFKTKVLFICFIGLVDLSWLSLEFLFIFIS